MTKAQEQTSFWYDLMVGTKVGVMGFIVLVCLLLLAWVSLWLLGWGTGLLVAPFLSGFCTVIGC